jgi:amino acid transporter
MNKDSAPNSRRFGAFGGVFTPSVLTILGVILFLRAGWVVGNVGLLGAIIIIIISHGISLSTGLSLSAIATSMKVKAGGNYYMISRTLGLEIGGCIGIPLYLSQALSLAFYAIGFTEGLRWVLPQLNPTITASLTCILLTSISIKGADWAIKIQYFILAVLSLSLISFFSAPPETQYPVTWFRLPTVGFWTVFAVFFPAVTGLEVGVSMSGDLKEPEKNIPLGTLWAIAVTFLIYITQAFWLAMNVPQTELVENLMIMKTISRWPVLIYAGLWAATLSSGLGSIMAAPRTMQALAQDRILPRFMGKGTKETNEPRTAIIITFIIAQSCILMGNLDVVAPIISMFFLNTYGIVNLIAALENLSGNPSYRPKFKVHWMISIMGAFGCYVTMFLIHATATVAALFISLIIYVFLRHRELKTHWGDVRYGLWYSLGRFIVFKLENTKWHPRNWRPNVMVFSGNPNTRKQLIEFANLLGGGKGIVTIYQLILGNWDKIVQRRKPALDLLKNFIRENELHAFGQVHLASNFREGIREVAQAHGLGQFRSNLVLLGWCQEPTRAGNFASLISDLHQLGKSVLILKISGEGELGGKRQRIDVWWKEIESKGDIMFLIANLVCQNPGWEDCQIRINTIIKTKEGRQSAQVNLESILRQAHIKAQLNVLDQESIGYEIPHIIRERSRNSDLVILGMKIPETGQEEVFMQEMFTFLKTLPTTLLVKSVEEIELIS